MKSQKVTISESFEAINIKIYIKTEEEEHQMEFPITEEYTSSTTNENIVTDFQNLNLNTTETEYANYDTNINIENNNIDTTYNIPITTTTYENTSDNYLQNIESSITTNNIIDNTVINCVYGAILNNTLSNALLFLSLIALFNNLLLYSLQH